MSSDRSIAFRSRKPGLSVFVQQLQVQEGVRVLLRREGKPLPSAAWTKKNVHAAQRRQRGLNRGNVHMKLEEPEQDPKKLAGILETGIANRRC